MGYALIKIENGVTYWCAGGKFATAPQEAPNGWSWQPVDFDVLNHSDIPTEGELTPQQVDEALNQDLLEEAGERQYVEPTPLSNPYAAWVKVDYPLSGIPLKQKEMENLFLGLPAQVRAAFYGAYSSVRNCLENNDLEAAAYIIGAVTPPAGFEQAKQEMLDLLQGE
jgi:hypothetical protein